MTHSANQLSHIMQHILQESFLMTHSARKLSHGTLCSIFRKKACLKHILQRVESKGVESTAQGVEPTSCKLELVQNCVESS